MLWISAGLSLLAFCYALVSILLIIGVNRVKKNSPGLDRMPFQEETDLPFVSVLVAARDEEKHISGCLESLVQQQYPLGHYEVVIVNDRSTDRTPDIISEYQGKCGIIKCINIESNTSGLTGKQNALNEGLRLCTGEIIMNTDADCVVKPSWIRRTVSHFTGRVGLTIGFSIAHRADGSRSFSSDIQSLDMLFLIDAAAGAIGLNVPVSGLGRNLAYRKEILDSYLSKGYTLTEDTALIQTAGKSADWNAGVVYDRDASVITVAEKGLRQFLSQRVRWVMGGQTAGSWSQIPLNMIFLFHLCLAVFLPLMFFIRSLVVVVLLAIFAKILLDFIRCWRVCREFRQADLLKLFVPYEIFMVFYSIVAGLGSIFIRKIRWKGETYLRKA